MDMSQANMGDYPISCIGQNKSIWDYGYKRNKWMSLKWNN